LNRASIQTSVIVVPKDSPQAQFSRARKPAGPLLISILALLTLTTPGCGTSVNTTSWAQNLERYVREDGRGDPNVLRDLTLDENRHGFALAGAEDPTQGADAKGLLLGHKVVNGQPWFIYLVGIVKNQKVEELRLAALRVRNGEFKWIWSPKNNDPLHMYRNFNEGQGKQRFPGQRTAPAEYSSFPRSDAFDLKLDGSHVTAVHKPSGAWWELNLPG
jgi:hypothetical protein